MKFLKVFSLAFLFIISLSAEARRVDKRERRQQGRLHRAEDRASKRVHKLKHNDNQQGDHSQANPAVPAQPANPVNGGAAIPAVPAEPAQPAAPPGT